MITTRLRMFLVAALGAPLTACNRTEPGESCIYLGEVDPTAECPTVDEASAQLLGKNPCWGPIKSVTGAGTLEDARDTAGEEEDTANPEFSCCYPVMRGKPTCPDTAGRPLRGTGAPLLARTTPNAVGWRTEIGELDLGRWSSRARAEISRRWRRAGLAEHASVAAFSELSLDLLAIGAPAALVEEAHRAALDEIQHAQICFTLASAYAGRSVGPGPLRRGVPRARPSLLALTRHNALDGCVGETLGAALMAEAARVCTAPKLQDALWRVADDEARHAALSWRLARWTLQTGGARVRPALERALFFSADEPVKEGPPDHGEALGLLSESTAARVRAEVITRVIRPCAERLLA